jgi:predicted amidophosphoribosyltransferase
MDIDNRESDMVIQLIRSSSAWDYAVSLDKHKIKSTPIGYNEQGYMQFVTERTIIGEAVFQLKYRSDFTKVELLAAHVVQALQNTMFPHIQVVIPMPASKKRERQPVHEVAESVANKLGVYFTQEILVKVKSTSAMKDLGSYQERVDALEGCFEYRDKITEGPWNVLVVDDLYDTGASIEAACTALRKYNNIASISVITLTRRQ